MSSMLTYLNGQFIYEDQARLSLRDAGFVWGAIVTDRCRTYGRKLFRWHDHLQRFRQSCELCRISQPVPDAEITLFVQHLMEQNSGFLDTRDEFMVILFATPGEFGPNLGIVTEIVHGSHYRRMLEAGAKLVTPQTRHVPAECVPREAKMRSRMFWWIAEQEARDVD